LTVPPEEGSIKQARNRRSRPPLARTITEAFGFLDVIPDNYPLIRAEATAIANQVGTEVERDVRINTLLVNLILGKDLRAVTNFYEVRLWPLPKQSPCQFRESAIYCDARTAFIHGHKVDIRAIRKCALDQKLGLVPQFDFVPFTFLVYSVVNS
jgi:hypothetical protein